MSLSLRPRRVWLLFGSWLWLTTLLGGCAAAGNPGAAAPITLDSSGAAANYLAGRYAFERGDYATAAKFFRRALATDPRNLELARRLFRIELAIGSFDEAAETARQLSELAPALPEVRLFLALLEARDGRMEQAARALAALPDTGVVGLAAPLLEGWALFASEGPRAGRARLRRETVSDGLERLYLYHRAMMSALAGELEKAAQLLAPQLEGGEPAPTRLVHAAAFVLAELGRREEAAELLRKQLAQLPENPLMPRLLEHLERGARIEPPFTDAKGGMADALLGLAQALRDQNLTAQSVYFAALASALRPEGGEGWLLLAQSALARGDADGALALLDRIPEDSADFWDARLLRANALVQAGRKQEAVRMLEQMARERPQRIDALVTLGDIHRRDEEYALAEKAYAEALRRLGEADRAHWRLLYVHGITLERLGRWDEAEARFLAALDLVPDQPFVLNYLGYSWVDRGVHLERAKEMLRKAVELRPDDGFIVDSLGWAHFRLGEYEEAVRHLEKAVELEPGDPVINDHLGDAYWQVGRRREARFQWERALSLEPDPDLARSIERKLRFGYADAGSDRG